MCMKRFTNIITKLVEQLFCCFKKSNKSKQISKIVSKPSVCPQSLNNHETLLSNDQNKITNTNTIDKVLCMVDEFILDLDTIIQITCGPGSQGFMTIDSLDVELSGAAIIIDIMTGGIAGCQDGCPAGSTGDVISPDGKQATIVFDEFLAEADGDIPSQSFVEKCCSIGLEFLPDEPNKKQIIKFDITFRGFVDLTSQECFANLFVNSNNIVTFNGPISQDYVTNITINAILACPQNPQITITNQNITAKVFEADLN